MVKTITETLIKYNLPISFDEITKYRVGAWNRRVREPIERQHKNRLTDECFKTEYGFQIPKTKTLSLANIVATNATTTQEPHNKNFLHALNKRQKKLSLHVMEC